jgi:Bacterial regulatory proteins, luxR family
LWDRATLVKSGFRVTPDNAQAVAQVACRLDGIPLAIELAAARMKALARPALEPPAGTGPDHATASGGAWPRGFLSDREQAVLRLIAERMLNKQIATSLGIGERTVKSGTVLIRNPLRLVHRHEHEHVPRVRRRCGGECRARSTKSPRWPSLSGPCAPVRGLDVHPAPVVQQSCSSSKINAYILTARFG